MLVVARGKMSKPIAFRTTEETAEAIKDLMKKEKLTKSEAVNKLIEKGLEHRASTEAPPKPKAIFELESERELPEWLEKDLEGFLKGKKPKSIQYFFSNAYTAHARGLY